MSRRGIVVALLSVVLPVPAAAQFVTPLPRPFEAEKVKQDIIYKALRETISDIRGRCVPTDTTIATTAALVAECMAEEFLAVRASACKRVYNPENDEALQYADSACINSVADSVLEAIARGSVEEDSIPSVVAYPGKPVLRRRDLMPLFRSTGFESLSILRQFATNIDDEQIFVISEVLSGSIGFLLFGVTYAAIVLDPDSVGNISADTVRNVTASLSRLINNGGTVTARLQYPIVAGGGTNHQHAASAYTQVGLLGPASEPDSLKASAAFVAEWVHGFTVRRTDVSDQVVAELIVGGRIGWGWSESLIAPGVSGKKSTGFIQLGVGVARIGGEGIGLSVLVTPPWLLRDELEEFVPRAVINLSMLR